MTARVKETCLPDGWRMARLGDVSFIRKTQITPKHTDNLPYIGLEHIASRGPLLGHGRAGDTRSAKVVFQSGDTLFGKLRPNLRKTVRVMFGGVCSTDIIAMFPSNQATAGYLSALMRSDSVQRRAIRTATGTRMPRTSWPALSGLPVPLPPLEEQQRIAKILDSVDQAIERTDAVIGASEGLRDALLHHLLSGERSPRTSFRSSGAPTDLPDGWRMVRLGDVSFIRKTQITPKHTDNLPYIGLEHIASRGPLLGHGRAGDTRSAKVVFQSGDTLFGKLRPNLRKTVRVMFGGVCSTDIIAMFPSNQATAGYLSALMRSDSVQRRAIRTATGTRMPRTSWPALSGLPVPLPPLEEQQRIAKILDSVDQAIERTRAERAALVELKESLAAVLLSGRLRVGVGG